MTYLVYDLNLIDQTRITGPYLYGRDVLSKSDASSVATIPADGLNGGGGRLRQHVTMRLAVVITQATQGPATDGC